MSIQRAAEFGEIQTFKRLSEDASLVHKVDEFGKTALHYAAEQGSLEMVDILLANGANPNVCGQNGLPALHLSCLYDKIGILKLLTANNERLDLNAVDFAGNGALHFAAMSGSSLCAEHLLSEGADINSANNKKATAVMFAALYSQQTMIRLLTQTRGCDVNHADCYGETSLHYAARCGLNQIVRTLMECKADKNKQSAMGQKPIDVAVTNNAEIQKLLN